MAAESHTAFQNDAEIFFVFFGNTIDNKPRTVYTIVTKKKTTGAAGACNRRCRNGEKRECRRELDEYHKQIAERYVR